LNAIAPDRALGDLLMIAVDTVTTSAVPFASRHTLRPTARSGNVTVQRETLFAGHAECPGCRAFVRRLTPLGTRSAIGELVAGWCAVCCTTTYFAAA
jgi:hypothetical protein